MVALILSGEDEKKLVETCRQLIKMSPSVEHIQVYGPAPAPILMLRGRYRYRFLIRSEKRILPQNYIKHWLSTMKIPKDIRLHIDIDPISFL
jgi:primosomal protein N' (replication factor Y)